ncbi:acetate/propionate family kinase [Propionicimonas sp.]|uniref:acetate/propionate family kinase n=1 Tax=Propionicimonas sp. TaxID=1955623 RepID=UPI0039E71A85
MSTPVLLLNCGSSSIKYKVIDADSEAVIASGIIQRIGEESGTLDHKLESETVHVDRGFPNHARALTYLVRVFNAHGPDLDTIRAVGHRTVHGGEAFRSTVVIDDAVLEKLKELSPLAPLHNPPGIAGIEAAREALPDVPHVAIFDTAFFATLPPEAYTYAVPVDLAKAHGIRKYGFHGTSHSFVSRKAAEFLGRDYGNLKQIVCHLGNGASISAIDNGVAVETSMGLTPLAGLVMGTRSGDVDPGLHAFLGRELGMDLGEVDNLLNKKSGMLGLAGVTDFRDLNELIEEGDEAAALALDVYCHRLISFIGAYIAVLGGVDVISFTAGVGENDSLVRSKVVGRLAGVGAILDEQANQARARDARVISTPESPITVLVVPTNEELAMARETKAAIS